MKLGLSSRRGGASKTTTTFDLATWPPLRGRVAIDRRRTSLQVKDDYDLILIDCPPAPEPIWSPAQDQPDSPLDGQQ